MSELQLGQKRAFSGTFVLPLVQNIVTLALESPLPPLDALSYIFHHTWTADILKLAHQLHVGFILLPFLGERQGCFRYIYLIYDVSLHKDTKLIRVS